MNILPRRYAIYICGCGGGWIFSAAPLTTPWVRTPWRSYVLMLARRWQLPALARCVCVRRLYSSVVHGAAAAAGVAPGADEQRTHACFLRSHTAAAEYSRPGRRFCPRVEQKPLEPDVRQAPGLHLSDCLPPRAPLSRGASRHRRDFTPLEIKE